MKIFYGLLAGLILFSPFLAHSTTYQVTSILDDGSAGTWRWAIQQANNTTFNQLDTIQFNAPATITMITFPESINDSLVVFGEGWTIDGDDTWQGPKINSWCKIFDLIIFNCRWTGQGAGMVVSAHTELINCTVTNCTASSYGGGIRHSGSSDLILTDCVFNQNVSNSTNALGGGALFSSSSGKLTLDGCTFIGNSAPQGNAIQVSMTDIYFAGETSFGVNQDIHRFQGTEEIYLEPTFCIPPSYRFSMN